MWRMPVWQAMVLVSTDKAINPTSIMGTTKRLAEYDCQSLDVLPQKNKHDSVY